MCVNNLAKVATQWNSGATRDSNRGRRVLIPSALTTTPPSHTNEHHHASRVYARYKLMECLLVSRLNRFHCTMQVTIRCQSCSMTSQYQTRRSTSTWRHLVQTPQRSTSLTSTTKCYRLVQNRVLPSAEGWPG